MRPGSSFLVGFPFRTKYPPTGLLDQRRLEMPIIQAVILFCAIIVQSVSSKHHEGEYMANLLQHAASPSTAHGLHSAPGVSKLC